jgi:hypothetical protein
MGDRSTGRQNCKITDADVYADHGRLAVVGRNLPFHLDGEGNKPAVGSAADGGGQNTGSSLLHSPGELASGLVSLQLAEPRERNVVTIRLDPDRVSSESAGVPGPAFLLGSWESDWVAFATAVP